MYHLGRLLTYTLAGAIAGLIGGVVDTGGETLGFQLAAARLVGTIMLVLGLRKLWLLWGRRTAPPAMLRPSRVSGWLVKLRPHIFALPLPARALATGLLTTLLPCGWLYLFALVAGGTASPLMGAIVMAAFWLGTVPALTGLIVGTVALSQKFTTAVPVAAAVVLVLAGCYTASGRGFASLNSLNDINPTSPLIQTSHRDPGDTIDVTAAIDQLSDTPLPCCAEHASESERP
jgi:sulfite exporter TauE/SafE